MPIRRSRITESASFPSAGERDGLSHARAPRESREQAQDSALPLKERLLPLRLRRGLQRLPHSLFPAPSDLHPLCLRATFAARNRRARTPLLPTLRHFRLAAHPIAVACRPADAQRERETGSDCRASRRTSRRFGSFSSPLSVAVPATGRLYCGGQSIGRRLPEPRSPA